MEATPSTLDAIRRKQALAAALMRQGTDASPVGHWTQAAARVANALVGGYQGMTADNEAKAREAYDKKQAEAATSANRAYSEGAMQREVNQRQQLAQQAGLTPGTPEFQQYVYGIKPPDPNADLERRYKEAQIQNLERGTDINANAPASVREWQHFSSLTPEQQNQYLAMKRAQQTIDLGTSYGVTNPMQPGQLTGQIPKDLVGAEIAKGTGQDIAKTRAELPEAKLRMELVTDNLARLKNQADMVINSPGLDKVVGGLWATYAPNITENALNAGTDLENLKVKISGVVLQSMRDMSKTGGAVGQVTEREWPRLENMIANLDTRQGKAQFLMRLRDVQEYAANVTDQIRKAYQADLAKAQGGGMAPTGGDGFKVEFD